MKHTRRILSLILLVILCALGATEAQAFKFTATVDKTRIAFDDTVVLSFIISGEKIATNITPTLPDLSQDFDVLRGPNRSSSISIINGNYTSSITFQYVLSAKRTGPLEIGQASIQHDKKTYTTMPITIEVTKSAAAPPAQSPSPGDQAQTPQPQGSAPQPEVFIQANADKDTAYLGEQVTISYMLYTRVNIAGYDLSKPPDFTGFWVEELQIPTPPKLEYRQINGQQYGVALLKKVALFPTTSGKIAIDPMVMRFSVKSRSRSRDPFDRFFDDPFFGGRTQEIIRKTQPLDLIILPLPEEQRPPAFNGNVGHFTMSARVDSSEVKQNDPITLTVTIQGTGNIKTVKEPLISLPESFKRYDTQISEAPFSLQEPIQGEKTFETVIIPSEEGTFEIPSIQFSFFDPQRQAYKTLQSQPISIGVLPGATVEEPMERHIATKEDIKLLGQDIRFIATDATLTNQGRFWYQNRLFQAAHLLPLLLIGLAYAYKRYRATYMRDTVYQRQKRASKQSKKHLRTANECLKHGQSKECYAAISSALRQYLGDKLNRPAAGIHGAELRQPLSERGVDDDTIQQLHTCLEQCDFARFAPGEAGNDDMQRMIQQAEDILDRLERVKWGKPAPTGQRVTSILVLFAIPALALYWTFPVHGNEVSPETRFQEGNRMYEAGHYREAIEVYQDLLASGLENGYVYYNLGNAFLKEQRIGDAILNFERAKRLLPRNEDVAFNLQYARALTLDKMETSTGGPVTRFLRAIRDSFTPNEVSLVFWGSYGLLTALILAAMFTTRRWRRRFLYGTIAPAGVLLVSGMLLLSIVSHIHSPAEAILLASKSEAKTGPGEAYSTVFEIHEGANVRIQREKQAWVEIQLPNNVIGWVKQEDLRRIYQ